MTMLNTNKKPLYKVVEGIIIPEAFSTDCFLSALQYKPYSGDVFVTTYPKCGTTWVQNIVIQIYRKGKPLNCSQDFFLASPFLDMLGMEGIERMHRPGPIKTHLPFEKVPYSPEAKYIQVARNPKDCCTSLYYHTTKLPMYSYQHATFNEFFELFIEGNVEFNDYFDHLISWYKHRHDSNVLFLTYEGIKTNHKESILQIARFLGQQHANYLERDPSALGDVVHHTSFEYMKSFISEAFDRVHCQPLSELNDLSSLPKGRRHIMEFIENLKFKQVMSPVTTINFVRKGEIMDWKAHLTSEQSNRLSNKFIEKAKRTDLLNLWKDYM